MRENYEMPTVTLIEIAEATGAPVNGPVAYWARKLKVRVGRDWKDEPAVSPVDAKKIRDEIVADAEEARRRSAGYLEFQKRKAQEEHQAKYEAALRAHNERKERERLEAEAAEEAERRARAENMRRLAEEHNRELDDPEFVRFLESQQR